jgi:hypothetical protein
MKTGEWKEGLDQRYLAKLYRRRDAIERAIEDHVSSVRNAWYADYYQKEYARHLNESIKHGDAMMANLLLATINGNLVAKPLPDGAEPYPFPEREQPQ